MKLRKFLAAATAITLLLGAAATPEVGSEIKLALTAHAESGEIPIDEEHFPDEAFRKYVKKFDTDGNNSFSAKELAEVTEIDCYDYDISSLVGVEYFTDIKLLDCGLNKLTSLDVSKNTKLKEMWCDNNKLTSLDVSNNTVLRGLQFNNNNISSIDISNNPYLISAYISGEVETDGDTLIYELYIDYSANYLYVDSSCKVITDADQDINVSIDENYFPDDNFRAYISENIDTDSDGKLSAKEIYAVNELKVPYMKIKSLKGIEYFAALAILECQGNLLESLDVSKNTKLVQMWCDGNQLSSLDISGNNVMTKMFCNNNQLTALDVSKNTALEYLSCNDNKLTSLDVSNNTALTNLSCDNNQLTSIDVGKNTALEYLSCDENKLTSIDISKNAALSTLYCAKNQLTSLDLSKNAALGTLYCPYNRLTDLDLSKNPDLYELNAYENEFSWLDISNNTCLVDAYKKGYIDRTLYGDYFGEHYYCVNSNGHFAILYFNDSIHYRCGLEIEVGTAKVLGMQKRSDIDIAEMRITFTEKSGQTISAPVGNDCKILLMSLPEGEYTVKASFENCPSREYEAKVEADKPVALNIELKLYGDIDGDGEVTVFDAMKVNKCAQMVDKIEGYDLKVCDFTHNNRIDVFDCMSINAHVNQTSQLW